MPLNNGVYLVTLQVTRPISIVGKFDENATLADVCTALNSMSNDTKKSMVENGNNISILRVNKATYVPAFEETGSIRCDVPHIRYAQVSVKKTETVTLNIPLPPVSSLSNRVSKSDMEFLEDHLDEEDTMPMLFDKFPNSDPEYAWELDTDHIAEADELRNANVWNPDK